MLIKKACTGLGLPKILVIKFMSTWYVIGVKPSVLGHDLEHKLVKISNKL